MAGTRTDTAKGIGYVLAAIGLAAMGLHCGGSDPSSNDGTAGSGFASGGSANGAGVGGSANGTGTAGDGTIIGGSGTGAGAGSGTDGGLVIPDPEDASADAFFVDDPPPLSCVGGGLPPKPGGTPECPDDKNLPGCKCDQEGAKAPCWTGYRKHRNHGACKDGETTCVRHHETQLEWGKCEGMQGVDPTTLLPLGAEGKAACGCFSSGFWKIENTSPCFAQCTPPGTGACPVSGVVGGFNTYLVSPGNADCPPQDKSPVFGQPTPPVPPSEPPYNVFSKDTVTVDCTGYFKLCYTFKALGVPGDPADPAARNPADCIVKTICSEAHYDAVNTIQPFPDLASWVTDDPTQIDCAGKFVNNGGYAEMSVDGQSDECEKVQKVFQTFVYCPLTCNDPDPAKRPAICATCTTGGGGAF